MSTPQGTGWTPVEGSGPRQGTGGPPPPHPGEAAPSSWPPASAPPSPVWSEQGARPPAVAGYAAGAPEVTTTATGAPARDAYAEIDPFRTDGTGVVRTPPQRPGVQYRLDAPPGTWGPPPVWAPPPRTDPLAIASLVVGIVGLFLFPFVVSQVGLVLGIVAARRVRRSGDQGFGLAVAGIVVGALGTLFVLAMVGLFATVAWWSL